MNKEIMGAIDVMAYGYNVKIFINGIDIGIRGGNQNQQDCLVRSIQWCHVYLKT